LPHGADDTQGARHAERHASGEHRTGKRPQASLSGQGDSESERIRVIVVATMRMIDDRLAADSRPAFEQLEFTHELRMIEDSTRPWAKTGSTSA
jgi:hypothetical protein